MPINVKSSSTDLTLMTFTDLVLVSEVYNFILVLSLILHSLRKSLLFLPSFRDLLVSPLKKAIDCVFYHLNEDELGLLRLLWKSNKYIGTFHLTRVKTYFNNKIFKMYYKQIEYRRRESSQSDLFSLIIWS